MIDLKNYRIVDLSMNIRPGIRKANGEYVHGNPVWMGRRFELTQFIFSYDKTFMHWVTAETHIGTHVEGPCHYPKATKSVSDLPVETYMGEAILIKLEHLAPRDGKIQPVTPKDLAKVKEGDIVLLWSPCRTIKEMPYLAPEAARWLQKRHIKMLGIENVTFDLEAPENMVVHETLLMNDIPIIEGIINLEELKKERFFFIGIPPKIEGLDSAWIRAIALEEL